MSTKNIQYVTDEIERFYASNRIKWEDFYLSERVVLERLSPTSSTSVLDVGCGCGGLGLALKDQFGVSSYTGVEINLKAVETARELNQSAQFFAGDILDFRSTTELNEYYDLVISLSCIDWNIEFNEMLRACWKFVKPGGYLLSSFRLTLEETLSDLKRSFQYISFNKGGSIENQEIAPYVVMNGRELMNQLYALEPHSINGYGYWGLPSETARTECKKICFTVLAIQKGCDDFSRVEDELTLPEDILESIIKIKNRHR